MTAALEASTPHSSGLLQGKITDETLALMRERIGYPNPTLRAGIMQRPWNSVVTPDAIYHWALGTGDGNPLYCDPDYARKSRWGKPIAPPGYEFSAGWDRPARMPEDRFKATSKALRGVQLYYSGADQYFHRPMLEGAELYKSQWVQDVQLKESRFATRSAIVTNGLCYWDQHEEVSITGTNWYVHAERRGASKAAREDKNAHDEPAFYTDEQMVEIEAAYDHEYVRGPDTLYLEDVKIGQALPRMAKGPLTVTDMINMYMACGWITYGNPPYRLAFENRKKLRGFYSRDRFNNWDSIQRVHWDQELANAVGVRMMYDIGPMRQAMLCHYCTNFAGDDGWVYRLRFSLRNFNYVGDVTWITGIISDARDDATLGPLVELHLEGTNQRGKQNMEGTATILVASRKRGPARLPPAAAMTPYRLR
jgi:acyl dehydratase